MEGMTKRPEQPSDQIYVYKTKNATLAFYDRLSPAHPYNYSQLMAKGEYGDGTWNEHAKITISLWNRSREQMPHGGGNETVKCSIEPENAQFLLSRLTAGFPDVEFSTGIKIFGNPDPDGLCDVTSMTITRHETDGNGNAMNYPWHVEIMNGKGRKVTSPDGRTQAASGSICKKHMNYVNLSDSDMFTCLKRVDSYITAWEITTAANLIPEGKEILRKFHAMPKGGSGSGAMRGGTEGAVRNGYGTGGEGFEGYGSRAYQDTSYQGQGGFTQN